LATINFINKIKGLEQMADRPWTAVATDKALKKHVSFVFTAGYDTETAADSFKASHGYKYDLVALIPGDHKHVYVEGKHKVKRVPHDQMFSGF
tara:strand:+ start:229 stop:507 length:279 start_codon:yes stop_codon:yes gene_type:complete